MSDKKDRGLDIPAEANRDKHINFLEAEERTDENNSSDKDSSDQSANNRKRREEWQKGLKEGEEIRNKNR